jgi:phosphoribosyl 1,2-cyclic phosphodiesterase
VSETASNLEQGDGQIWFDAWGTRGSRSLAHGVSAIGTHTSCYSLLAGENLCVIDAGRGLSPLGAALTAGRLGPVKRVVVLLSHAHMDHWEGLHDVDWFWRRGNGLAVTIMGTAETLAAVERAFEPPAFVPLGILALGTVASLDQRPLASGARAHAAGFDIETRPLHHYSGGGDHKRHLDAIGFRVSVGGASVAYLSDHEPTPATASMEDEIARGAQLLVCDAQYVDARDHAYGHGSIESAARIARGAPATWVLTAHHGPTSLDATVEAGVARHGAGVPNLTIVREGDRYLWDTARATFVRQV